MNEVEDTKWKLQWKIQWKLQPKFMDVIFVSLENKIYGPFLWMGSIASRLEPLGGGSLLFITKFPEIPGTHFIELGRMES